MMQTKMFSLWVLLVVLAAGCQSGKGDGPLNAADYLPKPDQRMQELEQVIDDPITSRTYERFQFGNLLWLGKNLAMTVGSSWCYGDERSNCGVYGNIYTVPAAEFACARLGDGWRVPTLNEWKALLLAHGGYIGEDRKPRGGSPEAALVNLSNPNLPFQAKIGGLRTLNGEFIDEGVQTFFWTSTEETFNQTNYAIAMEAGGAGFKIVPLPKESGGYCRCVQD